jgi:hypothetical protein
VVKILGPDAQLGGTGPGNTLTDMVVTLRELPQATIDPATLTTDERLYLQRVLGRSLSHLEHITLEQAPSLFSLDGAGTLLDPVQPNGASMLLRQDIDASTFFALMKILYSEGVDPTASIYGVWQTLSDAWTALLNDPAIVPGLGLLGATVSAMMDAAQVLDINHHLYVLRTQFQVIQNMVYNAAPPTIHTDVVNPARAARIANLQRIWPFNSF